MRKWQVCVCENGRCIFILAPFGFFTTEEAETISRTVNGRMIAADCPL